MNNRPLTDEQLWGVPEPMDVIELKRPNKDFCPLGGRECSAWADGCQVEKCIFESDK